MLNVLPASRLRTAKRPSIIVNPETHGDKTIHECMYAVLLNYAH